MGALCDGGQLAILRLFFSHPTFKFLIFSTEPTNWHRIWDSKCRYPHLMKSILKLGSLFALIIAGRYMQLAQPAASAGLAKAPVTLFIPTNTTSMTLTTYKQEPASTIVPVNQRKKQELPLTWF
jgi:hypothetical protein